VADEPIDQLMTRLRAEYLSEVPNRLAEIDAAIREWVAGGEPDPPLKTLFHRLSGSAGAYGFEHVTQVCRLTEQWLAKNPARGLDAKIRLERALAQVKWAFEQPPSGTGVA
jgi:HPt (histidine-containing phosphotransfer) domain-containing protein